MDSPEKPPTESSLPLIPVRNAVLFPQTIIPLIGGRDLTQAAVERAARLGETVGFVTQKDATQDSIEPDDLYLVGTEAKIARIIRLPDGTQSVVAQGLRRFRIERFTNITENELRAEVTRFPEDSLPPDSLETAALAKGLKQLAQRAVALSPSIPNEFSVFIENIQDPTYLANVIVPHMSIALPLKQEILETVEAQERLKRTHLHLAREIEVLEMSHKLHSEVRTEMTKQQRRHYVKEQIRVLQRELGELEGRSAHDDSPDSFLQRIESSTMPQEAKEAALREVERLRNMHPGSPEAAVSHGYVTWLLDMPWGKTDQKPIDLKMAQKILDEDHHGLDKVKRRIVEHLAVLALRDTLKGPILLLVGPPGVGKTSLGQSVARALGRKFARISLGGVRDEADIRGHRRTYIGSMPGRIAEAIKKAGAMDPVILLDEVDKLGADHRGDPASALLEVLDSEQNSTFVDHYLNVPLDLSRVLFLCTANNLFQIPEPLRDRMEILELPGYTPQEKTAIAERHLLPKVIAEHGLQDHIQMNLAPGMLQTIITEYTREAGVRQLRRELSALARAQARLAVEAGDVAKIARRRPPVRKIGRAELSLTLGPPRFPAKRRPRSLSPGVATGLAYTAAGGDVLSVESTEVLPGTGRISITGQLGDVMRESVETALSCLRAQGNRVGLKPFPLNDRDVHIHFPEGAVRKDGPSAGVAIFLAFASLFLKKPLSPRVAVTGEVSLSGKVLPVGGIKEKLLAAHRYGIATVLIPRENEKDLLDLPAEVRTEMNIVPIDHVNDALALAFSNKN